MNARAIYIFEGISEAAQLKKIAKGTFVHYHKHGEVCNEKCYVHPKPE